MGSNPTHGRYFSTQVYLIARADLEAGTGPEKSQNIGLSSNTGPNPLKMAKLPSQHSM